MVGPIHKRLNKIYYDFIYIGLIKEFLLLDF